MHSISFRTHDGHQRSHSDTTLCCYPFVTQPSLPMGASMRKRPVATHFNLRLLSIGNATCLASCPSA